MPSPNDRRLLVDRECEDSRNAACCATHCGGHRRKKQYLGSNMGINSVGIKIRSYQEAIVHLSGARSTLVINRDSDRVTVTSGITDAQVVP